METLNWVFWILCLCLLLLFLLRICIMLRFAAHTLKAQGVHYDLFFRRFRYGTHMPSGEIFARLERGEEREQLRYDYDHLGRKITIYWQGGRYGDKTAYEIEVVDHGTTRLLCLKRISQTEGRKGFGGLREREKRLARLNLFWQRVADAQPVPFER